MGWVQDTHWGGPKLNIWQEEEEEVDEDWDEVLPLHRPHWIFGDESLFDVLLSSTAWCIMMVTIQMYPDVESHQAVGHCSFVGSQET